MAKSHITKVKTETSFVPKKIKKQKLLFKCKINELNWIQDSPKKKKKSLDTNRAECYYVVKLLTKPKVIYIFFQYINLVAENDYDNMSRFLTFKWFPWCRSTKRVFSFYFCICSV